MIKGDQSMSKKCQWNEDESGWWYTDCGEAHEFTTGGVEENRYKFCPYCGKTLEEKAL